jgi:hypothetical protein
VAGTFGKEARIRQHVNLRADRTKRGRRMQA